MVHDRGFIAEVEAATAAGVRAGTRVSVEDVAAALFVSRATLQRRLHSEGDCFTEIRRRVQVAIAVSELTNGRSCAAVAASVGLSGEHLCRLVHERTGLRPREIARASRLAARAQRWRRATPPRSGTRLYRERSRRWRALEKEVRMLLAPVPASRHPLSGWARRTMRACVRPDYRTGRHRARARAARRGEHRAREAERRRLIKWLTELHELRFEDPLEELLVFAWGVGET